MALKVYPGKGKNGFLRVRGSVRGERVDRSAGTCDRRLAEDIAARWSDEIVQRHIFGEPEAAPAVSQPPSFAKAYKSYIQTPGRSAKENRWFKPLLIRFGLKRVDEITAEDVQAYVIERYPDAKPAAVMRAVIAPMRAVLRSAGVTTKLPIYRFQNARKDYLTEAQARRLIAESIAHLQPLLIFLLSTGARLGEALALDWREVDLQARRVVFLDTKNGETRGVPLNAAALTALANLKHRTGRVFLSDKKRPYALRDDGRGGQIKRGWREACIRAGLWRWEGQGEKQRQVPTVTPHILRHTFASWLVMKGAPLRTVAELLGHKTLAMVQRYSHLSPEHLADAVDSISLGGEIGGGSANAPKKPKKIKAVARRSQ